MHELLIQEAHYSTFALWCWGFKFPLRLGILERRFAPKCFFVKHNRATHDYRNVPKPCVCLALPHLTPFAVVTFTALEKKNQNNSDNIPRPFLGGTVMRSTAHRLQGLSSAPLVFTVTALSLRPLARCKARPPHAHTQFEFSLPAGCGN